MQRIIKGDQVVVITGRDRGTKGTVLSRVDDRHIIVEGVNVVKKAVRESRSRRRGWHRRQDPPDRSEQRHVGQPGNGQGRTRRLQGS